MGETVEHWIYGTLPVIETWTDCYHTKTGWRGRRKSDGAEMDVGYDPRERAGLPPVIARMPDKNWGISWDKDGHILGAIRIERRVRAVSRKGRRGKARAARAA
jgi:hypothetical protein